MKPSRFALTFSTISDISCSIRNPHDRHLSQRIMKIPLSPFFKGGTYQIPPFSFSKGGEGGFKNETMELFDFLVTNTIYPICSKKGRIFLRCSRKNLLTVDKTEEIITRLNIKTAEDCERIRNEVKKAVTGRRENRPIKEWIREERPREMLIKYGPETLSLSKLLAIILRTGREGTNAEELAKRLLNKFGTLRAIDSAPLNEEDYFSFAKAGVLIHKYKEKISIPCFRGCIGDFGGIRQRIK